MKDHHFVMIGFGAGLLFFIILGYKFWKRSTTIFE